MFADFVKLILGLIWPVLVGLLFWLFRDQIKVFLASFSTRNVKVGPQGIEVSGPLQQPAAPEKLDQGLEPDLSALPITASADVSTDISQYFMPAFRELITETQVKLDTNLAGFMQQFKQDRDATLRRLCIDYEAALYMERASRYILGSQIDAINFVSANINGVTKEQLRPFYTAGAASMPIAYALFPFEQWLSFLTNWNLMITLDDKVSLTAAGRTVVPYMQTWGYLNVRPAG